MSEQLKSKITITEMLDIKAPGIHVTKAMSFNHGVGIPIAEYKNLTKKLSTSNNLLSEIEKVVISDQTDEEHALLRWNTRVGPIIDAATLETLMEYIVLHEPQRINIVNENFAYLDGTICFYYSIEKGIFRVHTFYGRSNLRPSLTNIAKMKIYNMEQSDQVILELQEDELNQPMPLMPKSYVHFKSESGESYELFQFNNKEHHVNDFFYFYKGKALVYASPLHNMPTKELPFDFLKVLYWLGYEQTVFKNLYQNQMLLAELTTYYSKNAVRSFKYWLSKRLK